MNLLNSVCSFGKRKNERGEIKSDQEEIKDLRAIDFLHSHCMCLFWSRLCWNILYHKDCSGFSRKGGQGGCTTRKLNLEKTDRIHNWNTNRLTSFIRLSCKGVATALFCLWTLVTPPLKGTKQPHWEEERACKVGKHGLDINGAETVNKV